MPANDPPALRLEQALDAVHIALMSGHLADLPGKEAEIAALLPLISGLRDAPLARRLNAKAHRNAACLDAAARGLRAARHRLAEILAAKAGFATYDVQGRRAAIASGSSKMSQRF